MANKSVLAEMFKHTSCFWLFTDIPDCPVEPCNGHGTCTDGVNTYTCTCDTGYDGNDCEISKKYSKQ